MYGSLSLHPFASCSMNQGVALQLKGILSIPTLQYALNKIVRRHEALSIRISEDGSAQWVGLPQNLPIEILEKPLSKLYDEVNQEIDTNKSSPMRVLLTQNEKCSTIVFICNHLLIDGLSMITIISEISKEYNSILKGSTYKHLEAVPFSTFVSDKEDLFEQVEYKQAIEFWNNKLIISKGTANLPIKSVDFDELIGTEKTISVKLGNQVSKQLQELCRENGLTFFSLLLSAFELLLAKATQSHITSVGVPFAGQVLYPNKSLIGQCDTMLPLLMSLDFEKNFMETARELQSELMKLNQHHLFSLSSLIEHIPVELAPEMDVIFNLDSVGELQFDGLETEVGNQLPGYCRHGLFVNIIKETSDLDIQFRFNSNLLDEEIINEWLEIYINILELLCGEDFTSSHSLIKGVINQRKVSIEDDYVNRLLEEKNISLKKGSIIVITDSFGEIAFPGVRGKLTEVCQEASNTADIKIINDTGVPAQYGKNFSYKKEELKSTIQIEKKAIVTYSHIKPDEQIVNVTRQIWASVLGVPVEDIGIEDDFLKLGGNSLKLIAVGNEYQKSFGKILSPAQLFANRTIASITAILGDTTPTYEKISPAAKADRYPISNTQKGIFIVSELNPNFTGYNVNGGIHISEKLNHSKLQDCINSIMERHETLRTSFHREEDEVYQVVHDFMPIEIPIKEAKNLEDAKVIAKQVIKPFDLSKGYLINPVAILLPNNEYILFCDFHHIIADGNSATVFFNELLTLMNDGALDELGFQYKDFLVHNFKIYSEQDYIVDKEYWLEEYSEMNEQINLSYQKRRPDIRTYKCNSVYSEINSETTTQIKSFAQSCGGTLYSVLLAAYFVIISHDSNYAGNITIGTPVDGRNLSGTEKLIGAFINTLCIKSDVVLDKTFKNYVNEVVEKFTNALGHQKFSYEDLIRYKVKNRLPNRNAIIDFIFAMQSDDESLLKQYGSQYSIFETEEFHTEFDLAFNFYETEDSIKLRLDYSDELYAEENMKNFLENFVTFISNATLNPKTKMSEVEIHSEDTTEYLLNKLGKYEGFQYNDKKLIRDLFNDIVQKTPNATALVCCGAESEKTLTYLELDNQTNKIVNCIISETRKYESKIVGFFGSSQKFMVESILAGLKSLIEYVPIYSGLPIDRILYIVDICKINVVICENKDLSKEIMKVFQDKNIKICAIDYIEKNYDCFPVIDPIVKRVNTAYTIFTSGTTGRPKGVEVSHDSISNLFNWRLKEYNLSEKDNEVLLFNYSFDGFLTATLTPLISGATLYVLSEDATKDPDEICRLISQKQITHFIAVPTLYGAILDHSAPWMFSTVKKVTLAGEALKKQLVEKSKTIAPHTEIINEYGPTENTVATTIKRNVMPDDISIGKPSASSSVYIFNTHMKLQTKGVEGELYIAGSRLAKRYKNVDSKAKKPFVMNPYKPEERLYATGDIAKFKSNNELEFIGRIDTQINRYGYRIELSEIESTVLMHHSITDAFVHFDKKTLDLICLYVSNDSTTPQEVRKHIASRLPEYMVPQIINRISKFEYTDNGKVDVYRSNTNIVDLRKALEGDINLSMIESLLLKIWQDVLKQPNLQITDNFFEFGGDSIKAIQVASRCQKFGYIMPLNAVMHYQTIKDLAKVIPDLTSQISIEDESMSAPLSPIQHWFFDSKKSEQNHFNQAVLIRMRVKTTREQISSAIQAIYSKHNQLKAKYINEHSTIMQVISENAIHEPLVEYISLKSQDEAKQLVYMRQHANELHKSLNIETGDISRVVCYESEMNSYLCIIVHHLSIDAVSWQILLNDFEHTLIHGGLDDSPRSHSFTTWANYLNANAINLLSDTFEFWDRLDFTENRSLLDNIPKQNMNSYSAKRVNSVIQNETINKYFKSSFRSVTEAEVFLGAFINSLDIGNKGTVAVMLEGHGREQIYNNINVIDTVGWFTTQYPLTFELSKFKTLVSGVRYVRQKLSEVPFSGFSYGVYKYLNNKSAVSVNTDALSFEPEILFNYLGDIDATQYSQFEVKDYSFGEEESMSSRSSYILEVDIAKQGNQIKVSLKYNSEFLSNKRVNTILAKFENSLMDVVGYLEKGANISIPKDFATNLPISDLDWILQKYLNNVDKIVDLTPMQSGMLFEYMLNPNSKAYLEQISIDIIGGIDIDIFEEAINYVIAKHEGLRIVFEYGYTLVPKQIVLSHNNLSVEIINAEDNAYAYYTNKDQDSFFDIRNSVPLRVTVIKLNSNKCRILWTFHHILIDGWCIDIILRDLMEYLNKRKNGTKLKLSLGTSVKNYQTWHQTKSDEEAKTFWNKYLSGYIPCYVSVEKSTEAFIRKEHIFVVKNSRIEKYEKLLKQYNLTKAAYFQAAWTKILCNFLETNDMVNGVVISGRNPEIEGVESLVGLLINTLPLRVKINENESLLSIASKIQADIMEFNNFGYISLAEIQKCSGIKNKLFDNMFSFENYANYDTFSSHLISDDFEICNIEEFEQTTFPLSMILSPIENGIEVKIIYDKSSVEKNFIDNIENQLTRILDNEVE